MKVYILTKGEYSEYKIIGAFSTLELANNAKAILNDYDVNDPGEYELDLPYQPEKDFELGDTYKVTIFMKSGETFKWADNYNLHNVYRHPSDCVIKIHTNEIWVRSPISAEHAEKVAIEQRQKHLREG
jgi:hypothetical protein